MGGTELYELELSHMFDVTRWNDKLTLAQC